jgi:hypothetical protein
VFPQLYLPVMEESNVRVLRPHRKYLPTPSWFRYRARVAQLNAFLVGLLRARWAARQAGESGPPRDILDRILASLEVRCGGRGCAACVGRRQRCAGARMWVCSRHV